MVEALIEKVEHLLPEHIRRTYNETRRQAVLIVFAVCIANAVVPIASLLVWSQGHGDSAFRILSALVIHTAVGLLLFSGLAPRLVAHLLLASFFAEIAWDYGPDAGLGVMGAAVIPLVAAGVTGSTAGIAWTVAVVAWCLMVAMQWVRPGDYSSGVAVTTALVATVVGVGSCLLESMRESAVRREASSRNLQREAESAMQRFLQVTFPAHVLTVSGVVTDVSPGVATLLDYSAEDLIGRKLRTLLHPEDQPLVEVLGGPERGESFHAELRLWHKAGRWVWVDVFGVLAEHRSSTAAEPWWFVARDIELDRQLRERLARTHRLEGLGVMAAGLAHDFNNLLMVIRGFAELLPQSSERSTILEASGEASNLAANLMAFGRKGNVPDARMDVCAAIRKWSMMLTRVLGPHIRLELVLPDQPAMAAITDGQLNQVLLNLVTNAKDAMPDGGSLQIRVETIELAAHQAALHGLGAGTWVRMAVIDSGHGMNREVLAQAVDPFFTTKAPSAGSGLGLASVYGIVTGAGGSLELESEPGAGTSVLVWLPMPMSALIGNTVDRLKGSAERTATLDAPDPESEVKL